MDILGFIIFVQLFEMSIFMSKMNSKQIRPFMKWRVYFSNYNQKIFILKKEFDNK